MKGYWNNREATVAVKTCAAASTSIRNLEEAIHAEPRKTAVGKLSKKQLHEEEEKTWAQQQSAKA